MTPAGDKEKRPIQEDAQQEDDSKSPQLPNNTGSIFPPQPQHSPSLCTGRNFKYYKDDQLSSLTFTDRNEGILTQAKSKFAEYADQFKKTFVEFKQANVDHVHTLTKEDSNGRRHQQQFDTVVDTFGLCSCNDPEQALISLADACKPSEKSRILLLEHGRSHYEWLNRILDTNVDKHVRRWGCWWNRDLMELFEREKVKEKLEIVKVYRWHLGTTCYIVAKPKSSSSSSS
ncbi:hypothetical protein O0I10_003673 [Lichtheimia ornata]|uniref:Uncharacterized protein n=1 Tax=Lichtheimia ornata TaxID=688661 RepID=A0AAD7V824_9FUNG|nr:uncharacterized protein O0I10_003673 [Lichtheimia ornata]KAJ8660625.1 hypothetical protein O0I10_003673 [Lichtheimia ornata]